MSLHSVKTFLGEHAPDIPVIELPASTATVALAAEVGMASTSGVEKHLKALREAGCIRRVGPAKGGTWEVLEDVL